MIEARLWLSDCGTAQEPSHHHHPVINLKKRQWTDSESWDGTGFSGKDDQTLVECYGWPKVL